MKRFASTIHATISALLSATSASPAFRFQPNAAILTAWPRLGRLGALVWVGVVCGGCVAIPVTGAKREREVVYSPAGWPEPLTADVYRPRVPPGGRPLPAVLLVHGGGMRGAGARWEMNGIAAKLVSRGYVVMNVSYRSIPNYRYPAPVNDMRQALNWLRTHAAELAVDRRRIATFGYSAGGYLGALVALQHGPADQRVRAIVAGGAPFDLRFYPGGNLIPTYLGGNQRQVPALYDEASPVNYVHRDSPPIFIYQGDADTLVRPEHAMRMQRVCQLMGARCEVHWLRGHGHVGTFLFSGPLVDQAIGFLDREMK